MQRRSESTMARVKENLATEVDADLLAEVRRLADREGRDLRAVVEEALRALVEERRARPRAEVMAHYEESHERFASLYERLAE